MKNTQILGFFRAQFCTIQAILKSPTIGAFFRGAFLNIFRRHADPKSATVSATSGHPAQTQSGGETDDICSV